MRSRISAILLAGFTAGTLDILAAIFLLAGGNAAGVFRFIAKGAVGDSAFEGGAEMIALGALFHYIIAFSFTIGYFVAFPMIPFLRKYKIASGVLYGIFVWAFMQYVVLPLTHNPPGPFSLEGNWKNIVILLFAVGLPVSLFAHAHYRRSGRTE